MTSPAAVEAGSVSSLTNVLASPPQYPRNPTHEAREPFVLYIVRVPGSKDVVLTPLKPPTKASISFEAIQSCLYYFHVDTEEDEVVRASVEAERRASAAQNATSQPVPRKPLPPTPYANYPVDQRPPTPPKNYPHYQPPAITGDNISQLDRYAARGSNVRLSTENPIRPPPTRKPLGARPLSSAQTNDENRPPHPPCPAPQSSEWELGPNTLPNGKGISEAPRIEAFDHVSSSDDGADNHDRTRVHQIDNPKDPTAITVIRRDATSGIQWNVGTILVGARRHYTSLLQPVEICLTSPGYSRFANLPVSPSQIESPTSASVVAESPEKVQGFRRRVGFRPLPNDRRPSLQHVRVNSQNSLANGVAATNNKPPQQVFSFLSPWNGICTFSNALDGRSLKCRHFLPTRIEAHPDASAPVAELRFNLPWPMLRTRDAARSSDVEADKLPISQLLSKSKKAQWRTSVQHLKHGGWRSGLSNQRGEPTIRCLSADETPPDGDTTGEDRISLKLGREKAGGGFKGNSAKLGKLILEDEGLKMGDLIVSACMGVWWQHYMDGAA